MINEELAIPKVEEFLVLVQTLETMWDPATNYVLTPLYKETNQAVDERLPLIKQIAEECDGTLISGLERGLRGSYGFSSAVSAVTQLLGLLRSAEESRSILSPPGPRLSAANMHPWVWGVAAKLWSDGHHPQAVQTAASSIFDANLPTKLGLQKGGQGTNPEAMVGKAFNETSPVLLIPGYIQGTQDWTNVYQGTKYLGLACAKLVRNLGTHNVTSQGDEDELLEELAMLSRFARIVDSST
jgi:hypothetical protein